MKRFGVIIASNIEYNSIVKALKVKPRKEAAYRLSSFNSAENKYFIIQSGIGREKAGACTRYIREKYKVDEIINIGIAGGLDKSLDIGSVLLCNSVFSKENTEEHTCSDKLTKNNALLRDKGVPVTTGAVVTTDKVITKHKDKVNLKKQFNVMACEMEAAGVMSEAAGIPVSVIKVISDFADEKTLVAEEIINSKHVLFFIATIKMILRKPLDTVSSIFKMWKNLKIALARVNLVMKYLLVNKE